MSSPVIMTRVAPTRIQDAPMFNRYVKALQRSNVKSATQFHLHRQLAQQMLERRKFVRRPSPIILEVGAHTGWFLRHMLEQKEYFGCKQYIQCDVSEERLNENYNEIKHLLPEGMELVQICADEEQPNRPFEVPDRSIDMAVSCLSLQWVNMLEQTMVNIRNVLKRDGFFMLSMFGGNTLYEMRSAFALSDIECRGGMTAHMSPMIDGAGLSSLTLQAGFSLPSIDMDRFVLSYKSPFDVMEHVQQMGEQACHNTKDVLLMPSSKTTLSCMAAVYDKMYRKNGLVPATYEVFHTICWSPSPDQPQPLPRGSGQVSMASVGSSLHKEFSMALAESAKNPNDKALQQKADDLYKQLRAEMEQQAQQGLAGSPEAAEILLAENQKSPSHRAPAPPNENELREKAVKQKEEEDERWEQFEAFMAASNISDKPKNGGGEGGDK